MTDDKSGQTMTILYSRKVTKFLYWTIFQKQNRT